MLDAYTFYLFVYDIYQSFNIPTKANEFFKLLCEATQCNSILINDAISDILAGVQTCKPNRTVYIYLLSRVYPVRKVCKIAHISNTSYYVVKAKMDRGLVLPPCPFTPNTILEISKLLNNLKDFIPDRSW